MNKLMEYYYAERELHVEELISMIPSKVCSRATLLSLLTDCAIRKILTKTASPHDKRIKIVKPTPEFVNEFEKWSEEFYKFIEELKLITFKEDNLSGEYMNLKSNNRNHSNILTKYEALFEC